MKKDIAAQIRAHHATRDPHDLCWRRGQLQALKQMIKENRAILQVALEKDLGKSAMESDITELGVVDAEISEALQNLERWAAPQKVAVPLPLQPGRAEIMPEPYGVILIIGAWNYPVNLTLAPLVGCIAAGNAAVIKPSELAPATSSLLAELVPRYLDRDLFQVVEGGVSEATALLEQRFDRIFYTGGRRVGEIVMRAAAKHVTPLTLELGGKSPCIVDASADLELAARRIVFGKFINAGQTCVAPDYVLADSAISGKLTAAFKAAITRFYGDNPKSSPDYARIVNTAHFNRLTGLMQGESIASGGDHDQKALYIEPTILSDVSHNAPVMKEEVFGPLLPIVPVEDVKAAFDFVTQREKPLALYLFSSDKQVITQAKKISAGAIGINDVTVQAGIPGLPFGGVGASGFGKYHGKNGFDEFSHAKAIWHGSAKVDPDLRYPPYGRIKSALLRRFLK